jgi:uncharacterized membrane protein YfcA
VIDHPTLIVVIAVGAAIAGLVQGLSGFAFSLVALSVWAWSAPPQLIGPMAVFGSLVGQLLAIGNLRSGVDLRRLAPFVLGGLVGVPLGVAALRAIDPVWFKLTIGGLLIVYCPVLLFARELPHVQSGGRSVDALIGAIGGVMGGLGGMTGPAPALWGILRRWTRDERRALLQAFNLAMHTVTLAAYAIAGALTHEALQGFAIVAPAMLIPTLIGGRLYRRFSEGAFTRLVLILLSAAGIALLAAAAPTLFGRPRG